MRSLLIATLVLLACTAVVLCDDCTYYDGSFEYTWYCALSCCTDYVGCCNNYWYGWTAGSLVLLLCLCLVAGCGGYRYRRYYVVRTYQQPAAATVVTTTTARTATYQPQPGYQAAPPPYKQTY